MSKLLLHFLLFASCLSVSISAQTVFEPRNNPEIKIYLKNQMKPVNCKVEPATDTYLCQYQGGPLLLKKSDFGFMTLGLNSENEIETFEVQKVESKNVTIFEFSQDNSPFSSGLAENAANSFAEKISTVEYFFGEDLNTSLSGSKSFNDLVARFIYEKNKLKTNFDAAIKDNSYSVELENGQKLTCQRSPSRELNDEEKKFAEEYNVIIQCGGYKCNPVVVDGKTYEATMLYDSAPSNNGIATIHLTDANGFGPQQRIKKVFSDKMKQPLVDYSSEMAINPQQALAHYSHMFPQSLGADRSKIAELKNPIADMTLALNNSLCSDKSTLQSLNDARKKLMEKVANLELMELIQVWPNGSLVGAYIDPARASEYGCLYNGVILDPNAEKHLDKLKKNIHPDQRVEQTISLNRATELFKKAAAMKDIAWKYKNDGCYARAHLMARRFEAEGVRVDKVWIKGDLYVPGTEIRWNFHVAPIVYVDDGKGGSKKMVIDPSLFDKPVTVEEWDKRMAKNTAKGSVVTAFPFPENAALFERSALSFSSSDPYLPRDSIFLSEDQKMKMSVETMRQYKPLEPK